MSASALISIGFSNHGVSIIKFCDLVKKYGAIAVDLNISSDVITTSLN